MAKVEFMNPEDIINEQRIAGWMASVSSDSKTLHSQIGKHVIEANHGTPTRTMRFMFEISEVSRAFSHEFVRHEIGVAKVQRSQRYVNEDGFGYVTPKGIMEFLVPVDIPLIDSSGCINRTVTTYLGFDEFQDIVKQMYTGFTEQGAKPEDARYALTNATFTKIHVSFDWEGLVNFCEKRCCTRAQWEIREVANKIVELITLYSPFLGSKLGAACNKHGYCPEAKGCGKAPSKEEFIRLYKMGQFYDQDVLPPME